MNIVPDSHDVVVCGISWIKGYPQLLATASDRQETLSYEMIGRLLSYRCTNDGDKYCAGRYMFSGPSEPIHAPCSRSARVETGRQCEECRRLEGFSGVHRGGSIGPDVRTYLEQPHLLYIAASADGALKVGTAAECRRLSRLAEQGAAAATYVARAADGWAVRSLEDWVSRTTGVSQTISAAQKLRAVCAPCEPRTLANKVDVMAAKVREAMVRAGSDVEILTTPWDPPGAAVKLLDGTRRLPYPERIFEGEHGLLVEAMLGSIALVRVEGREELDCFVVDLAKLVGVRISFGNFQSSVGPTQAELF